MFITFWLICMFLGALVGNNKGRGGTGLVLGLLFGPLGIVFTALLTGDRRRCPECQAWIPKAASRCMHCRAESTPQAPVVPHRPYRMTRDPGDPGQP